VFISVVRWPRFAKIHSLKNNNVVYDVKGKRIVSGTALNEVLKAWKEYELW